jgi:signal transduction histidine kinase/AraC-like DNA-binding protein
MTQPVRIGLQVDSNDPFWVEIFETIWRFARPAPFHPTFSYGAPFQRPEDIPPLDLVEIEFSDEVGVADVGTAKIEEIMALGLEALLTVNLGVAAVRQLLDNGLPVIALSEWPFEHPRFSHPQGLYDVAQVACRHLVQRLGGSGRVAIVGGMVTRGVETGKTRVEGALDVFRHYSDIEYLHIPTPWTYDDACDYLLDAMTPLSQPFDAVFGLSDTLAFAGRDVGCHLGLMNAETVIVGVNGDPLAIAAIVRGEMAATVETSATELATQAVRLACQVARGEPIPPIYSYHPLLITRENVVDVAVRKLAAIADMPTRLQGNRAQFSRRRITQLETSLAINRQIGAIIDHELLPQQIAELIRTNYGYDDVEILLWMEGEQALAPIESGKSQDEWSRIPLAESGALGHTLMGDRPLFIPDAQTSSRFAPDSRWPATRSRVIAPIRLGGRTQGVLDLHSRSFKHHSQGDLDALQFLADQLGVAIRNVRLYAEALAARVAAEQASHFKTRLLANISHELRTPLNVILGYSQTALGQPNPYGVALPAELTKDLRHIQQSGEQLARLVNDLLELSQAEIGALEIFKESIEPVAFLREIFEIASDSLTVSSEVTWRLQLPARLPVIEADPERLRQIVLNLLSNAANFTRRGHIALAAARQSGWLHIWIEDTGAGIPKEQLAQIFESFVTVYEPARGAEAGSARRGIGLGLTITHHLMKLHGGDLHLESRVGRGTICHILLPLPEEGKDAFAPRTAPELTELAGPRLETALNSQLQQAGEMVQRSATYIRAHYADALTRQGIADVVGVSPNYLSRIFRRETGMTPWQYLNRYRVLQAQKLLRATEDSITAIAGTVGFSDPAYFSRVFRKETGMPPKVYRNLAVSLQ